MIKFLASGLVSSPDIASGMGSWSVLAFLILRAIRESKGFAISVSDEEIFEARDRVAANDGCFLCPEGAATMTAYARALSSKLITKNDTVVLFNCATGLKYPLPEVSNKIDKNHNIDYKIFINYP